MGQCCPELRCLFGRCVVGTLAVCQIKAATVEFGVFQGDDLAHAPQWRACYTGYAFTGQNGLCIARNQPQRRGFDANL